MWINGHYHYFTVEQGDLPHGWPGDAIGLHQVILEDDLPLFILLCMRLSIMVTRIISWPDYCDTFSISSNMIIDMEWFGMALRKLNTFRINNFVTPKVINWSDWVNRKELYIEIAIYICAWTKI